MPKQLPLTFSTSKPEKIFSVGEFLDYLNELMGVQEYVVQGEVTGASIHPTGLYFSLKDEENGSILNCYLNPRVYHSLGIYIEDGMQVKVTGMPHVYKSKGRLSMQVRLLELVGEGSLKKAYEVLKQKLSDEGLFTRKRPIPECIQSIGIITSRTGAVIDDFRKNVEKRGFQLHLYDVRVEGPQAVSQIKAAVRWFNKHMPNLDVLVIMRGGGSLEDMQAFNNELVAREVFASTIPTICAIGHDRDVPIVSLVGDTLTSTPTAAAMLINQSWQEVIETVPLLTQNLLHRFERALDTRRSFIEHAVTLMSSRLQHIFLMHERMTGRLRGALGMIQSTLATLHQRVLSMDRYLTNVNPERNLKLGYSIVRNTAGGIIRSITEVAIGASVATQVRDGSFRARVTDVEQK